MHRSFRVAYPLIDASKADVKVVKVDSIALQNILSLNHMAYCLQIELSELNWSILSTNKTPLVHNTAYLVSSSEIIIRSYTTGFINFRTQIFR